MGKWERSSKRLHSTGYPYSPIKMSSKEFGHQENGGWGRGYHIEGSPWTGFTAASKQELSLTCVADLKRLGFIRAYSSFCMHKGFSLASSVYYSGLRPTTPHSIDASLRKLEQTVSQTCSPLVNAVADSSDRVLVVIDDKVDRSIGLLTMQIERITELRQMFLRTVVDSVEDLWRKGLPLGAQKPAGLVLARVEEASCQGDGLDGSNELLEGVSEAWAKLTSLPPVTKLVETAQPSVEFTWRKYLAAHDAIVGSSTYSRLLDSANHVICRVQDSTLYKTAAKKVYPVISTYADPALDKITHSPYYHAVLDHLKPAGGLSDAGSPLPPLALSTAAVMA